MTSAAFSPTSVRRSSDLSKHSAEVFAEAEKHPVTVTRRDGQSLVLMSLHEANSRAGLLELAAQLVTASLGDSESFTERMTQAFPWMFALSPADRITCAHDLANAARASFATEQPHLALAELTSWRETAIAIAAGLNDSEIEWLDIDEPVGRP